MGRVFWHVWHARVFRPHVATRGYLGGRLNAELPALRCISPKEGGQDFVAMVRRVSSPPFRAWVSASHKGHRQGIPAAGSSNLADVAVAVLATSVW